MKVVLECNKTVWGEHEQDGFFLTIREQKIIKTKEDEYINAHDSHNKVLEVKNLINAV